MIENNRDEELCRKWDALADEGHTHHLTPQEYSERVTGGFIRTSKVPILCERRTDLTSKKGIVNFAAIETKRRRSFTDAHGLSQKSSMGTKFFFMVESARFMVDSLFL